jgi:hypothetical protein
MTNAKCNWNEEVKEDERSLACSMNDSKQEHIHNFYEKVGRSLGCPTIGERIIL